MTVFVDYIEPLQRFTQEHRGHLDVLTYAILAVRSHTCARAHNYFLVLRMRSVFVVSQSFSQFSNSINPRYIPYYNRLSSEYFREWSVLKMFK